MLPCGAALWAKRQAGCQDRKKKSLARLALESQNGNLKGISMFFHEAKNISILLMAEFSFLQASESRVPSWLREAEKGSSKASQKSGSYFSHMHATLYNPLAFHVTLSVFYFCFFVFFFFFLICFLTRKKRNPIITTRLWLQASAISC